MPEVPSLDQQTMSDEEIIEKMIDISLLEVNTCLPGVVKKYDSATQTCTVQPSMKRTSVDGLVIPRTEIEDVPVVFPRSKAGGIHFPIEEGDSVLLVFSQRSLDDWVDKGGVVEVIDSRVHDANDAIAIPGLFSLADKIDPAPIDLATEVRGTKMFLGDPNATPAPNSTMVKREVFDALDKLITQLLAAVYPTSMGPTGPMAPPAAATIQAIQVEIQEMIAQ